MATRHDRLLNRIPHWLTALLHNQLSRILLFYKTQPMLRIGLLAAIVIGGMFNANVQNVLKVQAGATLKTTGGVVITLLDMNLENDGTINQGVGDGIFRFTGFANNTISGTNTPTFDTLEIAKTGNAKLSLQRDINIGSRINFTTGRIDLNNNNILLQPAALLDDESETSRIIGPNGGFVEIINVLNNPVAVNPGNLGAVITSTQNLGSTTIRGGHAVQNNVNGLVTSIERYFDISPTNNTALDATLRFNYFDAELNGLDETTVVMWKSVDNIVWTSHGFTTRDVVNNAVDKTGIADFSRWTLSSPVNNPLPVQFMLFNVRCEGSKVSINWKTAQEINSSHFEIQRSTNGSDWTTIGTKQAAGNSNIERNYSFVDLVPVQGAGLYRIVEFDTDGRKQYTSINKADCSAVDTWKVWPNPLQQQLFVNIRVATGSPALIRVFDSKGSFINEQRNVLLAGSNQLNIDMQRLPPGTYHVVIVWDNGQTQKSVKVTKQ